MVEAVVEYDYDAVNPDELNLKEGEIISNINMLEEGWWEGELNGKRGMFPDNFVKVIKEDKADKKSKSRAPGPPVNGDTASIHSSQSQGSNDSEVVKRENSSAKRKFRAKVAFSYHPENEDELNLEVDDIIDVTGQPEDGWWEGVVRGHRGVFPSNFVTLLEEDQNSMDVTNGKADKTDSLSPGDNETKEPQQAPIKPIRPLSFKKGKEDSGLEPKGEDLPAKEEEAPAPKQPKALNKPVGGVGFGNIFAGGSVHLRRTNQDGNKPKKAEPPKRPELSEMAQKRQSLKKPFEDPKKEKKEVKPDIKPDIKPEPIAKKEEKKEEMTEEVEIVVEKAKVLFDYDAANPDELTLKEDDVIVITSKEAGDSGWWEGEINGRKGVFPDNFVQLLPPERTRKKVPIRPNAAPKVTEDSKPQKASKPRKGSKDLPAKPTIVESETPKEPTIKEEPQSKPHIPAGAKQILPMVPPKKVKKPPPPKPHTHAVGHADKETREVPKRPPSFIDKDKEKLPEKKELPAETNKPDKEVTTFDDIKPSTEKLVHVNLSRPRNVNKRPPSVFGNVPGVTTDGGKNKSKEQVPEQPAQIPEIPETVSEQPEQPIENDINSTAAPPPRPKTTPSPVTVAPPNSSAPKPEPTNQSESPSNSRPDSMETAAPSSAVLEAMDELKKEMKSMQDQMATMRIEFKKEVKKLMVEVDEEKKLRLSMQVELERVRKLVLDS